MNTNRYGGSRKGLQTTRQVWPLIKQHYSKAREAKRAGKFVAWIFGLAPAEFFHAQGVIPIFIDIFSGVLASKYQIAKYLDLSDGMGYPSYACGLHRAAIGYAICEDDLMIPLPDLIVATSTPCDGFIKVFYPVVEALKVPYYLLDSPLNIMGSNNDDHLVGAVDYYTEQLKELIAFIEDFRTIPLEESRLEMTINLAAETYGMWKEINVLRKTVPCPMGLTDEVVAQLYLIQLMGTSEAAGFCEILLAEVRDRVKNQKCSIEKERHRLLWVGNSPCYDTAIFTYFDERGAHLVRTDGDYGLSAELDPARPLETLSRYMISNALNSTMERRLELCKEMVRDYRIDGLVIYSPWGCRVFSGSHRAIVDTIRNEFKIPSLMLQEDMVDARRYNGNKIRKEIEEFLKILV